MDRVVGMFLEMATAASAQLRVGAASPSPDHFVWAHAFHLRLPATFVEAIWKRLERQVVASGLVLELTLQLQLPGRVEQGMQRKEDPTAE
jgi:hypothetical protein